MISENSIEASLSLPFPVIDVRSPAEFEHGHIPGAINIPLFSNDERAHVGTVYKQSSQEKAFKIGMDYVRPKLDRFMSLATEVSAKGPVIVHCWRGGMRSRSFAQHLSDNGFSDVKLIMGGYKAYRKHVLTQLGTPLDLKVLGGYTGSGKTHILNELKKRGKQIIDLEGLANHKGSAFGGIGLGSQPTVEQFENNLHKELMLLNLNKPIWVEDESHGIGAVKIPMPFFKQMRATKLYFIDIPKQERAKHLVKEYAGCDSAELAASIKRITKRLGGLEAKTALELLDQEKHYEVAIISLHYYDKSYLNGMKSRKNLDITNIQLPATNHLENAMEVERRLSI